MKYKYVGQENRRKEVGQTQRKPHTWKTQKSHTHGIQVLITQNSSQGSRVNTYKATHMEYKRVITENTERQTTPPKKQTVRFRNSTMISLGKKEDIVKMPSTRFSQKFKTNPKK